MPKSAFLKSPRKSNIEMENNSARKSQMGTSQYINGKRKYDVSGTQFVDNINMQIEKLLDRSARKKNYRKKFNGAVY